MPQIKTEQIEQAQQSLTAAKYAACERYYALQDEVRSVRVQRISCVRRCRNGKSALPAYTGWWAGYLPCVPSPGCAPLILPAKRA